MAVREQQKNPELDPRIYTDFNRLVQFKYMKNSFTLTPYDKASGLMSGRHLSRFRGRGLNFEEFRHYHEGDDIRSMDWRVTMRTRQPYVRVYSEEKDLPVILVVDQRKSMFFSSQHTMKSVVAAELGAICAWQVLKDSDRVGCLTFNDDGHSWISPQRSQKNTLQIVKSFEAYNHQLSASNEVPQSATQSLNLAFKTLRQMQLKGALVIMFSDFKGLDAQATKQLQILKSSNDVLGVMVSDIFEHKLQPTAEFYATNGAQQIALSKDAKDLSTRYEEYAKSELARLKHLFTTRSAPYIQVSTDGNHIHDFQMSMRGN
ncbi:DUF58 domain-containing protein [Vibrio ulleungensis]|uniref:DUF58 domain-containing protein n=1 Tax=Vibrio ulleungensis TaxID=2807619 RepID=A0ABS2HE19_9VIBR|nr:DUF58 domain-containing protein [Vibrio ulleungensis]MBM7035833.1 DUF58 domain-containing protein [Vibrio ulleungensis]